MGNTVTTLNTLGIDCFCCKQEENPNNNPNEAKIDDDYNETNKITTKHSPYQCLTRSQSSSSNNKPIVLIQSFIRRFNLKRDFQKRLQKRIQLFDINITKFGRFISDDEMNKVCSPIKKIEYEKQVKVFKVSENERRRFNLVFNKGAFYFNDNTIYKGNWNFHGKKHGYGIFIQENGSKYEGIWEDDNMTGRGRYIDIKGNYYEGQWKKGCADGKGLLFLSNGFKYEGDWANDLQNGYGKESFPDGSSYEGHYINGKKEGEGKFIWADGSVYEGELLNSVIHGQGTFKWTDGRKYTGKWEDNKMNGSGIFTWSNGKKYEGEYKNNIKEGYGTYHWNNNTYYRGNWLNNAQHGEGELYYDGIITKGIFRFGRYVKNPDQKHPKKRIDFNQEKIMNESLRENGNEEDMIPVVLESFRLGD